MNTLKIHATRLVEYSLVFLALPAIDIRCEPDVIGCWSYFEFYDGWAGNKMEFWDACMTGPGVPQHDEDCLQCFDWHPRHYFDDSPAGFHRRICLRDYAELQRYASFLLAQFKAYYDCDPASPLRPRNDESACHDELVVMGR